MLFQAEGMLSKRQESERKANEDFERIKQERSRLSNEKLNVVCIIALTHVNYMHAEEFPRAKSKIFFKNTFASSSQNALMT